MSGHHHDHHPSYQSSTYQSVSSVLLHVLAFIEQLYDMSTVRICKLLDQGRPRSRGIFAIACNRSLVKIPPEGESYCFCSVCFCMGIIFFRLLSFCSADNSSKTAGQIFLKFSHMIHLPLGKLKKSL